MVERLRELRELVDDLYDMIPTPTHQMSEQFLAINRAIDDCVTLDAKIHAGSLYGKMVREEMIDGDKIDWNDLKQVEELMGNKYQRMRAQSERMY